MTLHIVDAFTDRPFGGNPAAVCLLDQDKDADWMQAIAAEMNLSETAFVVPKSSSQCQNNPLGSLKHFTLRWFTPTTEVPLCGHATLASATVLFYKMGNNQVR